MSYSTDIARYRKGGIPPIVLLCAAVYMVSYITRINYSAVVVEIVASGAFSAQQASLPLTALFITYGFGQLVSGYLGDRFPPENVILVGLNLTVLMNLLMPQLSSVPLMVVVWGINGFAQALMWPPMVRLLSSALTPTEYRKNIIYVSYAASLGTIVMYLISPLIITLLDWKAVFYISAASGAVMAIIWGIKIKKFVGKPVEKSAQSVTATQPMPPYLMATLAFIIISVALHGVLKDGIATWMPSYLSDVFEAPSTLSILTGVVLPLFSMVAVTIAGWLFRRVIKNEALCSVVFYGLCTLSIALLTAFSGSSPIMAVAMLMVANAFSHGINLMYTSMVVTHFTKYGRTSFITGLINSATYLGSAASMYGVASITHYFGWSGTLLSWVVVSVLGLIFSALAIKGLKKGDKR